MFGLSVMQAQASPPLRSGQLLHLSTPGVSRYLVTMHSVLFASSLQWKDLRDSTRAAELNKYGNIWM